MQRYVLSRYRLDDFQTCRRRFQLRTAPSFHWPASPQEEGQREAQERGRQFHLMLERHLRGLPYPDPGRDDPVLAGWWQTFRRQGPALPAGSRLPELTVTVPLRHHFLTGRFDLLVAGQGQATLFDWKTEAHPRSAEMLQADLQSWFYLALVVEGWRAIQPEGPALDPDQVRLTYWYVTKPEAPVTLRYSRELHARRWAFLEKTVADLEAQLAAGEEVWPLTENWDICQRCLFQVFCRRQKGGQVGPPPATGGDEDTEEGVLLWEPEGPL